MSFEGVGIWSDNGVSSVPAKSWELTIGDRPIVCHLHDSISAIEDQSRILYSTALNGLDVANLLESVAPVKEQGLPGIIADWEMPDEDEPMSVDLTELHKGLGDSWVLFEAERRLLLTAVRPYAFDGFGMPTISIHPVVRWRQDTAGRPMIELNEARIGAVNSSVDLKSTGEMAVLESRVAGALIAAALVPSVVERWPEVMRLPKGADRQFIRAAQTPILALMSLRKALKLLP